MMDKLTDRLRGKYRCGPHLPNGEPEFGWKQFQAPPIQFEAAERIDALEGVLRRINARNDNPARYDNDVDGWISGVIDTSDIVFSGSKVVGRRGRVD